MSRMSSVVKSEGDYEFQMAGSQEPNQRLHSHRAVRGWVQCPPASGARWRRATTVDGDVVVLVKPQCEVGRERLGHGGVVRSASERARSIVEVATVAASSGLHARDLRPSPIRGTTGNAEYLLWLTPRTGEGMAPDRLAALAAELSAEGTA